MPLRRRISRGFCSHKPGIRNIFPRCAAYPVSGDVMFAIPVSVKRCKKVLLIAAAVLLAVGGMFAAAAALRQPPSSAESAGGCRYATDVSGGDYAAFFRQLNLSAAEVPSTRETVRIPGEFNDVYTAYNELQRQSGLDLTPYRGKEALRLTFSLHNSRLPYATLLVYGGRVIGGHLTSGEYGSVLQPLTE